MAFEFQIGEEIKGVKPERYKIAGAVVGAAKSALYNVPEKASEDPGKTSYLGTPVYSNFIVEPGTYTDLDGNDIEFNGIEVEAVLLVVSQSKNIVSTPIQGRNGTVKEYISDGDYQISVEGILINQATPGGNVYPTDEVADLVAILGVPDAITINSEFLDLFDINSAVVTDYSIGQVQGTRNQQPFKISLLSDTPIELEEVQISRGVPSFL